jgi:hypothetical protein
MLGWLVNERAIEPHIPAFDKSGADRTFSREDFAYDQQSNVYICPAGKVLASAGTVVNDGTALVYRAGKHACDACELKQRCCPKMPARKVPRSIHENARDVARDIARTEAYVKIAASKEEDRDAVRTSQAHSTSRPAEVERALWGSRRVPSRWHRPEPPDARKADPDPYASTRLGPPCAGRIVRSRSASSRTSSRQSAQSGRAAAHRNVRFREDCVAKLSLRRLTIRDSVGGEGISGSSA